MNKKELLKAKKSLEHNIFLAIENELKSFREQTGSAVDEIKVHFVVFQRFNGSYGSISVDQVICNIVT